MHTSVALCTYNGERYLREQLQSIREQSVLPDELVVCDDLSTDGTLDLLRSFAASAPFPVRIESNPQKLGATRNFERAITLCTGDIVFLADQDDFWLPRKMERFLEVFGAEPQLEGLFSNASIADANLQPSGVDLWTFLGLNGAKRREAIRGDLVQATLSGNIVFGTTFAIRGSAKANVIPFPEELPEPVLHDAWIALVLACRGTLRGIDEELSYYRQHGTQVTGVAGRAAVPLITRLARSGARRKEALRETLTTIKATYELLLPRFRGNEQSRLNPVRERISHMQTRIDLPRPRLARIRPIARELWLLRYSKYSRNRITAAVRDLIL